MSWLEIKINVNFTMMTYAYCGEIAGGPLVTRRKILVARVKFSVALATRKAQFRTLTRHLIATAGLYAYYAALLLEVAI